MLKTIRKRSRCYLVIPSPHPTPPILGPHTPFSLRPSHLSYRGPAGASRGHVVLLTNMQDVNKQLSSQPNTTFRSLSRETAMSRTLSVKSW